MIPIVYLTFHETRKAYYYGEQIFLRSLLEDTGILERKDSLQGLSGAVVSIRACDNYKYIDRINEELSKLKWCVVIITGNENSTNFHTQIDHPNCLKWLQTPRIGDDADYFLGFGWPTNDILNKSEDRDRDIKMSFSGQVNNNSRKICIEQLKNLKNTKVIETKGFNQGLPYLEYLELLKRSEYIACPSAITTPDSFRIYEALEVGSVPILDTQTHEQFSYIWGGNPLICVSDWHKLGLVYLLDFEIMQNRCQIWWADRKKKIVDDLLLHIKSIIS